jgi:hypothetical protein
MNQEAYHQLVLARNAWDEKKLERTRVLQLACLGQVTEEEIEATEQACLKAERAIDGALEDCYETPEEGLPEKNGEIEAPHT